MKILVTWASPHQGLYGIPETCRGWLLGQMACEAIRGFIATGVYTDVIQRNIIPATFWHDSLIEKEYREKSAFLADINNERHINETYVKNFLKVEKLILIT